MTDHAPEPQNDYKKIARALRNESPASKKTLRLKCHGTSMTPIIKNGDEILVARTDAGELKPGDIVTYEKNGGLITHRFLYRHGSGKTAILCVKADNGSNRDEPFAASSVVGKVIGIRRNDQIIDIQTRPWAMASFAIAVFSFLELKCYETAFFIKKSVLGNRGIGAPLRKNIKAVIQKPKHFLFRLLLFFSRRKPLQ